MLPTLIQFKFHSLDMASNLSEFDLPNFLNFEKVRIWVFQYCEMENLFARESLTLRNTFALFRVKRAPTYAVPDLFLLS